MIRPVRPIPEINLPGEERLQYAGDLEPGSVDPLFCVRARGPDIEDILLTLTCTQTGVHWHQTSPL